MFRQAERCRRPIVPPPIDKNHPLRGAQSSCLCVGDGRGDRYVVCCCLLLVLVVAVVVVVVVVVVVQLLQLSLLAGVLAVVLLLVLV